MKSVQPLWLLVFCPFLSHSLFAQVHIFCWRHSQKCLLCIVWSCLWKYDRNACFVCIAWYVCESMTGYKWLKMWCKIRYEVFFCLFFVCVPGEYILCVLGLNKFRTKESCVTLYHVLLETGVCSGWVLSVFLPSLGCVMKERLNSGLCWPCLPDCGWVPDGTSRDSGLLAQFTWLWLSTWWHWCGLSVCWPSSLDCGWIPDGTGRDSWSVGPVHLTVTEYLMVLVGTGSVGPVHSTVTEYLMALVGTLVCWPSSLDWEWDWIPDGTVRNSLGKLTLDTLELYSGAVGPLSTVVCMQQWKWV